MPKKPKIDSQKVDVTSEYEIFTRLPGNRNVSENHVQRLMEAMRRNDLFTPILVNQNFEVIDGQHRLEARKRLGLPVPYYWTEGLGLEQVQRLNSTQKGWSNDDYTRSYIELGKKDYEIYKWFREKYGLPHNPACLLLSGNDAHNLRERFQSGDFQVTNLRDGKEKAEMLQQIQPFFAHWKDAGFIKAFLIAFNREGFEFKTFKHRLEQNPTMLRQCPTIDSYLLNIEEVYNYRAVNKVPLRFGRDVSAGQYKVAEV